MAEEQIPTGDGDPVEGHLRGDEDPVSDGRPGSGEIPVSGGRPGGDGDPVEAEMRAVFAAALAGEPPSTVTPLSVLHRAHLDRSARRERRTSRIRRWGTAAGAAAAVVVAIVLLGPALGNRSGPSGTAAEINSAGGTADRNLPAVAGTAMTSAPAGGAAGSDGSAQSTGAAGSSAAGSSAAGSSTAEPGMAAPSAAGSGAAGSRAAESGMAAPDGAGSSGAHRPPAGTAGAGTASGACGLPPLLPAERAAAIDALPAGTVAGVSPPPCPATGAQPPGRGTTLRMIWPSATVTVLVTPADTASTTSGTSSGMPPGTGRRASVWVERDGVEVTVTADPAAAARLTTEALRTVAGAVLAAATR